ncbi:MAG: hypothetical protein IJU79_06025 [Desulfovibrionaceae bacterium]|nr:hypothetical protein [Desulfovibrionaceae bacterium]
MLAAENYSYCQRRKKEKNDPKYGSTSEGVELKLRQYQADASSENCCDQFETNFGQKKSPTRGLF